jgi:hypothetical protein
MVPLERLILQHFSWELPRVYLAAADFWRNRRLPSLIPCSAAHGRGVRETAEETGHGTGWMHLEGASHESIVASRQAGGAYTGVSQNSERKLRIVSRVAWRADYGVLHGRQK